MGKWNKFIKRFFSLRNLAPLVIIIGALIGSLGLKPFGLIFSNEQVILALLAFLAIDSLVERLDMLSNIEDNVKRIESEIKSQTKSESFFKKRSDLPRMEHLIRDAKKEIWISGITLETTLAISSDLVEKVNQGCHVRILALNPFGTAFETASQYFDLDRDTAQNRIYSHLINIYSKLKHGKKGSFEIRIYNGVFPTGYLAVDPGSPDGWMNIQSYLFNVRPQNAPFFHLNRRDDELWFSTYQQQFLSVWVIAEKFENIMNKSMQKESSQEN